MSGTIDLSELKAMLGAGLKDLDEEVWKSILDEADYNKDGVIDIGEFFKMMYKI